MCACGWRFQALLDAGGGEEIRFVRSGLGEEWDKEGGGLVLLIGNVWLRKCWSIDGRL